MAEVTNGRVPTDAKTRKSIPLATGCFDYFPDAVLAVAELSRIGSDQHNPGKPLHWDRTKSTDEADALARHFVDRGGIDVDGVRHSTKVAWRALALLQKEIEASRKAAADKAARSADIASECAPLPPQQVQKTRVEWPYAPSLKPRVSLRPGLMKFETDDTRHDPR